MVAINNSFATALVHTFLGNLKCLFEMALACAAMFSGLNREPKSRFSTTSIKRFAGENKFSAWRRNCINWKIVKFVLSA